MRRVLVVGGGSIGERHARCFINSGRAEVSLCESRRQRLEEMAGRYRLAGTFDDVGKVEMSSFDAVVICVPANLHVPLAQRAVAAGCHALIEKPLSTDLAGVPELSRAAEKAGVTVGVAYVRRAMRMYQIAKERLDSGAMGEVLDATYTVGYDHRVARPDYRNTYEVRRDMGGGAIQDALSHLVNLMQWLVGPVSEVMACYDHLVVEGMDAEDTASVLLRFRGRRTLGNIHSCMWHPCRTDRLALSSNDHQMVCDLTAEKLGVLDRASSAWAWTDVPYGSRDAKGQVDEPFMVEASNFLDAIEGKAPVLCSLEEAAHTVQICLAATESGRTRTAVRLNDE